MEARTLDDGSEEGRVCKRKKGASHLASSTFHLLPPGVGSTDGKLPILPASRLVEHGRVHDALPAGHDVVQAPRCDRRLRECNEVDQEDAEDPAAVDV